MSVPETLPRVYGAIAAVMSEISSTGVAKARENRQQGYVFRGIDDMYNALSGPLSRAKLVIIPRVISRDCQERQSAKGTPIFVVTVHVEFDIVSADDGSKHTAMTYGEAMDSADKATNKAMSAAWKYMAMELFCIPTDGDNDADAHTPELVANAAKPKAKPQPDTPKSVPRQMFESLAPDEQEWCRTEAAPIIALCAKGEYSQATDLLAIAMKDLDSTWQSAMWSLFESVHRSAIKRVQEQRRTAKAE